MEANEMTPDTAEQELTERLTDKDWQTTSTSKPLPDRATLSAAIDGEYRFRFLFNGRELAGKIVGDLPDWILSAIQSMGKLLELGPDWDTYGGSPVSPRILVAAIQWLFELFSDEMPEPSVVPTSRGGLQLEWHTRGIDLEVEFLSATRIIGLFEDAETGTYWEKDLSSDLAPLVDAISKLSKRQ